MLLPPRTLYQIVGKDSIRQGVHDVSSGEGWSGAKRDDGIEGEWSGPKTVELGCGGLVGDDVPEKLRYRRFYIFFFHLPIGSGTRAGRPHKSGNRYRIPRVEHSRCDEFDMQLGAKHNLTFDL